MNAREEAEQFRQEAISKLLDEQKAIEQQLELLGYGKEHASSPKRRGRPPKATQTTPEDGRQTQHSADSLSEAGSNPPTD